MISLVNRKYIFQIKIGLPSSLILVIFSIADRHPGPEMSIGIICVIYPGNIGLAAVGKQLAIDALPPITDIFQMHISSVLQASALLYGQ